MVAADIPPSRFAVSSSMSNSPYRRSTATDSLGTGASLLPAPSPSTDQHNTSAATAFRAHTSEAAATAHSPAAGAAPGATPYAHDHDATPW